VAKKYNNDSSLVQEWTTQKLKKTARSLHRAVYQVECFSTGDLRDYEACVAELEARGYTIKESRNITITK
jgi:hypothetical protein